MAYSGGGVVRVVE